MKKYALLILWLIPLAAMAAKKNGGLTEQDEYEKSIDAVVRHKIYYKANKLELTALAGCAMPYDSTVNTYTVGGRLTYYFGDHYGWEIVDAHLGISNITDYVNNLVTQKGLSVVDVTKINYMAATNFIFSPVYGKIRFFGSAVIKFDTYFALGGGVANTKTVSLGTTQVGGAVVQNTSNSNYDPMFDVGFGFKVYMSHALALNLDLRDYVLDTTSYGSKSLKSNFSIMLGLSFFLPTF